MAKLPSTQALRMLRASGLPFVAHTYSYVPRGGTAHSSSELGVPEHAVIKTLIFEDDKAAPLCVLMHGDKEVSAKGLARLLRRKTIRPCAPEVAQKHSGYQVGGTSPFGIKKKMPLYVEATILQLDKLWINGGARGLLVELQPSVLRALLDFDVVAVGL